MGIPQSELDILLANIKGKQKAVTPTVVGAKVKAKRSKYNVAPVSERTWKGKVYDSKGEMNRAKELNAYQSVGEIFNLQEQVVYKLEVNGILICKYIADFVYLNRKGETVTEDYKGKILAVYLLKKKLMMAIHGITIFESRAKTTKRKTVKRK